jgi:hypothetical protein
LYERKKPYQGKADSQRAFLDTSQALKGFIGATLLSQQRQITAAPEIHLKPGGIDVIGPLHPAAASLSLPQAMS